jgi:hypothetical protein
MEKIINQGTSAGGSKTNENGKKYEELLSNDLILQQNFDFENKKFINKSKKEYIYLYKKYIDKDIYSMKQKTFSQYLQKEYRIKSLRDPDEIYIIKYNNGKIIFYINEIKNQNVDGSVETKLWSCPSLKKEYELYFSEYFTNLQVIYSLTVSKFLQNKFDDENNKKYQILKQILDNENIKVFYGDDVDYLDKLNHFIQNL